MSNGRANQAYKKCTNSFFQASIKYLRSDYVVFYLDTTIYGLRHQIIGNLVSTLNTAVKISLSKDELRSTICYRFSSKGQYRMLVGAKGYTWQELRKNTWQELKVQSSTSNNRRKRKYRYKFSQTISKLKRNLELQR